MIFRLNLKTEKSVIFSTPNYTEFTFLDLLSYIYLKNCTILSASSDFASEKVFIIKNVTSKQTEKQTNKKITKQIQNLRQMQQCHNIIVIISYFLHRIWNIT